jgi:hypothetical protein
MEIEIGVETVDDWTEMSERHAALVTEMVGTMSDFAAAMGKSYLWVGGMRYQTIKGHAYLVRYLTGEDGKKVFSSLGRRSPENDALLATFENGRKAWKAEVERLNALTDEHRRMAKAFRIARAPKLIRAAIEHLHNFDVFAAEDPYDALYLAGSAALYAYEQDRKVVFGAALLNEDTVTLDLATCGEIDIDMAILKTAYPDARTVDDATLITEDGLTIRMHQVAEDMIPLVSASGFTTAWQDQQMIVGRDGFMAFAPVLSPLAFVSVELGRSIDGIHRRRAEAIAELYQLGLTFEPVAAEAEGVAMRPG